MLLQLQIRHVAVIESLALEFAPGLNVITGETGAGKSVILEALGFLLGDRASADAVRTGAERAEIQGLFESLPSEVLEEAGIGEEPEAVLRRIITAEGRSRAYVNDSLSTVGVLRRIGERIADIHGQFEHQSLLVEERQMDLLDRAAGLEEMRDEISGLWRGLRAARQARDEFDARQRERLLREDLLRFQVSEIDEAALRPGEEAELEELRVRLANVEKLAGHAEGAYRDLYADDGAALGRLESVLRHLEAVSAIDPGLAEAAASIREAVFRAEEAVERIRGYRDALEADPARLDRVTERLETIARLKRKYGEDIEAILAFRDRAAEDLESLESGELRRGELDREVEALEARYAGLARKLRKRRAGAAAALSGRITAELAELDMPHARFRIDVEEAEAGAGGVDRVRFRIRTNEGDLFKPLNRIASGGELSRVMLAIKTIMGDRAPLVVFDEVDAGIGGRTADAVGRRLKRLAADRQVICVTHLPQIAAYGDHHIVIGKEARRGGTRVTAGAVTGERRVEELARMLSGRVTDTSLRHGRELLETRAGAP